MTTSALYRRIRRKTGWGSITAAAFPSLLLPAFVQFCLGVGGSFFFYLFGVLGVSQIDAAVSMLGF
jgi:hypothetical protein